jgi:hypothetical protein
MEAPIEERLEIWAKAIEDGMPEWHVPSLVNILREAADTIEVLLGQRKILVEEKYDTAQQTLPDL